MNTIPRKLIAILFTGHVGSSWLLSLIDNHPRIRQLGFEPVDDLTEIDVEATPYFERVIHGERLDSLPERIAVILGKKFEDIESSVPNSLDGQSLGDFDYIAFKARVTLQIQRPFFEQWLPAERPTMILLRRRNKIKNAVSQFKRTQLNISHLRNFDQTVLKRRPIIVDPRYILDQATQFTLRELRTTRYFKRVCATFDIRGFEISYEELLSQTSRDAFLKSFYRSIGLQNSASASSRYCKITSDSLPTAVENYQQLADRISGTIFEPCLTNDRYDVVQEILAGDVEFPSLTDDRMLELIDTLFG